jgi:uncharacterized repeat protein (TIGR03803 family)
MTKRAFLILAIALAVMAPAMADGQTASETILHTFGRVEGAQPNSAPVFDSAGNLYGTTSTGGLDYAGSVYRLDPSGHYSILHAFTGPSFPVGVVLDSAGNLYGAAVRGGAYGWGAIYKLDPAGNQTVLYSFQNVPDGASPNSPLVWDSAGNLYGTTSAGGIDSYCTAGCGTVFKLDLAGNETVLYAFPGSDSVLSPLGVSIDSSGNLYGVTQRGDDSSGVLFKVDPSGGETDLYTFTGENDGGFQPNGGLLLTDQGIYGTTVDGGKNKAGVVYRFDSSGHFSVVYDFLGGNNGGSPLTGLVRDGHGNMYVGTGGGNGRCGGGCGTVFKLNPSGQGSVLHSFDINDGWGPVGIVVDPAGNVYGATEDGGATDGGALFKIDPAGDEKLLFSFPNGTFGIDPASGVIAGGNRYLYGTTNYGGTGGGGLGRWGVVYSISPTGAYNVLYGFSGQADGGQPGALIADSVGNLYGTAYYGGVFGYGAVFRVDLLGNETVLYSFKGTGDGAQPLGAGLAMDALGNLYGTTLSGAVGPCLSGRCGVVFKLAPDGSETVLHNFTGGADGLTASSAPVLVAQGDDAQGNLYGTTLDGGAYNQGLIYKIDPAGNYSVVYNFVGGAQGANPSGSFVRDKAGNFFGPADSGAVAGSCNPPGGCGVIYKLDVSNNLTILHTFTGADGYIPLSVVLDPAGNLYGNTNQGGTGNGGIGGGVIFKVDKGGTFSVVYDFDCSVNGCYPGGTLLLDRAGDIYGTTYAGGARQTGLVYKITQ